MPTITVVVHDKTLAPKLTQSSACCPFIPDANAAWEDVVLGNSDHCGTRFFSQDTPTTPLTTQTPGISLSLFEIKNINRKKKKNRIHAINRILITDAFEPVISLRFTQ